MGARATGFFCVCCSMAIRGGSYFLAALFAVVSHASFVLEPNNNVLGEQGVSGDGPLLLVSVHTKLNSTIATRAIYCRYYTRTHFVLTADVAKKKAR